MFKPSVVSSALVALACSSCSFLFVHPPHHADDQLAAAPAHCTSSPVAPIVDSIIATYQVVRTTVAISNDDSAYQGAPITRGADIGLGVGFATLFLASTIYGFVETNECSSRTRREAPEQMESRPGAQQGAPTTPPPADPHFGGVRKPMPQEPTRPKSPEEP